MGTPYFTYTNPIYQPAMRVMSAIIPGNPSVVTTTVPHLYKTGTIVRFNIPTGFGMQQVNQAIGPIIVTGSTTFWVAINSTKAQPLLDISLWPANAVSYPNCTAIGEDNSMLSAAIQNTLPHSAT